MMITTVRGSFGDVDGTLEIEEADAPTARGEIRVKTASINTGFGARDEHLRSADFFDAATWPEIVVRFDGVEPVRDDRYRVNADVTIRDTTRTVPFEVEYVGTTTNMKGGRHIAFSATAKIDREDWGLTWNMALEQGGWLVGKEIKILVESSPTRLRSPPGASEQRRLRPARPPRLHPLRSRRARQARRSSCPAIPRVRVR